MQAGGSSEEKLINCSNHGFCLQEWLSDNDLLVNTLKRLVSDSRERGSSEARDLVRAIKRLKGLSTPEQVSRALLAVSKGAAERFVSDTYRGRGRIPWKRSFFIDAKPDSPAFKGSDLDGGLQVLREYVALITDPDMPLVEYLPARLRQPDQYQSLVSADQPYKEWKTVSPLQSASALIKARGESPDPLTRVRSFLIAPGLDSTPLAPFDRQVISLRDGMLELVTGRAVKLKPHIRLLPELGVVTSFHAEGDQTVIRIHWPSKTDSYKFPEDRVMRGILYDVAHRSISLFLDDASHATVFENNEDRVAPSADSISGMREELSGRNAAGLLIHPPRFVIRVVGQVDAPLTELVRTTGGYMVMDVSASRSWDDAKRRLEKFRPQSMLNSLRKLPTTSEKQQRLGEALFTTDRSLAWEIIKHFSSHAEISTDSIVQMYRDTFP